MTENSNEQDDEVLAETHVVCSKQETVPEIDSNETRLFQFSEGFQKKFVLGKKYASISELRQEAVEFGKEHNVMITTHKSSLKRGYIFLQCKHGYDYREAKKTTTDVSKNQKKKRNTSTARSDCPMSIEARTDRFGSVIVKKAVSAHNHPLARDIRTYAGFRKLNSRDLETAVAMLKQHPASAVLKVLVVRKF